MTELMGMAAALAALVVIWFAVPLLMAPALLVGALVEHRVVARRAPAPAPAVDVHDLPAEHPHPALRGRAGARSRRTAALPAA